MSNKVLSKLRQMRSVSSTDNLKNSVLQKAKAKDNIVHKPGGGSPEVPKRPKLPLPAKIHNSNITAAKNLNEAIVEMSNTKSNSNLDLLKE